ncbi:MAG: protease SohB [Buchnera aphidicola (Kaburagia rhusicola rhusicola)]
MDFISNYMLFFSKIFTTILLVLLSTVIFFNIVRKKNQKNFKLDIISLNDHYESIKNQIFFSMMSKYEKKIWKKNHKKKKKEKLKSDIQFVKKNHYQLFYKKKPTLYVLDFKGNINATEVTSLREEISAILLVYQEKDEVLLRLESGGGVVNGYGLAASQLKRLREKNIHLTVSVDKIAASGGYMMACVANHIMGSAFSVIGSIGVIAQIPNFYKLLKKNNIDMELHTSGNYKRTLTMFGENTSEDRKKFCSELHSTHTLFREFVHDMRPSLNIEKVSNGKYWFGTTALKKGLIDSISTSDDFIMSKIKHFSILQLKYVQHKTTLVSLFLKVIKSIKNIMCKMLNI